MAQDGAVDFPFVDGVFIPNGTTQIQSDGSAFDFPNTAGDTWDAIRGAAALYAETTNSVRPIQLADQPDVDRRGLGMHSNTGITFDLEALRDAGHKFNRFVGVGGINFTASGNSGTDFTLRVLVDGEVRYQQAFRNSANQC